MVDKGERSKAKPTRQLILEAVIDCIEEYGIDHLTTRKIAEKAGTNIASINYHFRSKDELVAETLSLTIRHMMEDVQATLDAEHEEFTEKLRELLYYLIEGGQRFPGITTAQFYNAVIDKDYTGIGAVVMRETFERLVERACAAYPERLTETIRLTLGQIVSSILLLLLAPGYLALGEAFVTMDEAACRRLADHYVLTFESVLEATAQEG